MFQQTLSDSMWDLLRLHTLYWLRSMYSTLTQNAHAGYDVERHALHAELRILKVAALFQAPEVSVETRRPTHVHWGAFS